jgi:Arc/MetJ family transcription regulator
LGELSIDLPAWEDHAGWWEQEAERARERMHVDDDTIAEARQAFGKIGSSTVGAAYASALEARRAAGYRLGAYAESVAAHIRRDLQTYAEGEADGARTLST